MKRVGLFDSGVGGLSVWREIARQWPELPTLYVADQAHVPYGARPAESIRVWSHAISRVLRDAGCDAIVVACNTASAAALASLRREFPPLPFVGMEPAVKPAVLETRSRVAAVLATPATFQGALFATTVERFAADVRIVPVVCAGLVERIEAGEVESDATVALLQEALRPAIAAGADTLVLACTHYPFVRTALERILGPGVHVIDPSPAVARQLGRVLQLAPAIEHSAVVAAGVAIDPLRHQFRTTGDVTAFNRIASRLLGVPVQGNTLTWDGSRLATPVKAVWGRPAEDDPTVG